MKWSAGIRIILCVVLGACVSGCGLFGSSKQANKALPSFLAQQDTKEESTAVDVYWDATYSMQGYTTISEGNAYRTLPDRLEDVGNSMGSTKFFRFGEKVQPLEGREHRKFSEPSFYDETITAIHTVVDQADPKHLSVIVTDLFESDADWSIVAKKIKDKYAEQHLAVAIIGIKNPFNGFVYDFDLQNKKFSYDSGTDPKKYRPFYILVLGHETAVSDFLQRWKNKNSGGNETKYLFLAEKLMDKVPNLATMEIADSKNLFGDEKLPIEDKRIKEFGVNAGDKKADLTAAFKYTPVADGCSVDLTKLKSSVKVYTVQDEAWKSTAKGGDASFTMKEDSNQPGAYQLQLSFTPDSTLTKGEVNLLHAVVEPAPNSYVLPGWVKEWNLENTGGLKQEDFDGGKTINFLRLVESLRDSALVAAKPPLASMTLMIKY